jgi:hypothetical protein
MQSKLEMSANNSASATTNTTTLSPSKFQQSKTPNAPTTATPSATITATVTTTPTLSKETISAQIAEPSVTCCSPKKTCAVVNSKGTDSDERTTQIEQSDESVKEEQTKSTSSSHSINIMGSMEEEMERLETNSLDTSIETEIAVDVSFSSNIQQEEDEQSNNHNQHGSVCSHAKQTEAEQTSQNKVQTLIKDYEQLLMKDLFLSEQITIINSNSSDLNEKLNLKLKELSQFEFLELYNHFENMAQKVNLIKSQMIREFLQARK